MIKVHHVIFIVAFAVLIMLLLIHFSINAHTYLMNNGICIMGNDLTRSIYVFIFINNSQRSFIINYTTCQFIPISNQVYSVGIDTGMIVIYVIPHWNTMNKLGTAEPMYGPAYMPTILTTNYTHNYIIGNVIYTHQQNAFLVMVRSMEYVIVALTLISISLLIIEYLLRRPGYYHNVVTRAYVALAWYLITLAMTAYGIYLSLTLYIPWFIAVFLALMVYSVFRLVSVVRALLRLRELVWGGSA